MKYFSQKNLSMILSIAIVIVVVLIFAFSSFIKQAQADWYSTGGTWNYRKTITIDNVKVPNTDQTDFPVLVDITDSDLAANARSDGFDIFFTSSDGTTKLAHEREIYTTATGRLTTWVKVPTLSTSVDTLIYMYYGNASSGDMQDVAPIKTAVWDSNYKGVWHLGAGDSTAANFYQDSPTGNSDGTLTDGDGDVTQTDGQIGKAMNFNTGDVDFITTADTAEGASTITVSAWVKLTNNTDYHGLMSHTNGSSASDGWWLTLVVNQNNYNLSLSDADHTTAGFPSTVGNWYYLTVTFDDASNLGRAYHNGVPYVIFNSADQITESASTFKIGKEGSSYGDSFWLGGIDEVRLSGMVRTEQWIQTEYNNMSATSTFYTLGSEESCDGGKWYCAYSNRKTITVQEAKVTTEATDFPTLISFTDSDLAADALDSGADIAFFSAAGSQLNHEVESFDGTTGALNAWVKATLASTTDSVIYMAYGYATAKAQQDPRQVWDSNYKAIYHLSETSGQHADSTSNDNDSTAIDVQAQGSQLGAIAGGDTLSGASTDEVTLRDHASLDIVSDYTLSGWIKKTSNSGLDDIVTKGGNATDGGYYLSTNGDEVWMSIYRSSIVDGCQSSASNLSTGVWYYVTGTFSD